VDSGYLPRFVCVEQQSHHEFWNPVLAAITVCSATFDGEFVLGRPGETYGLLVER
jgi:hypothetical protein